MATIPRTYLLTDKENLNNIQLKNGQIIAVWNSDEVWYDAPDDGTASGNPIRRKISGIKVVTTLPDAPMEDIIYAYIGEHGTLPSGDPFYDLRVWVDDQWIIVGNNTADDSVKSETSDEKFYLVGSPDSDTSDGSLYKNEDVFVNDGVVYGKGSSSVVYVDNDIAFVGKATDAKHAVNAENANYASYDDANPAQKITSYLHDVSSDATLNVGSTLTFTLGDGTKKFVKVSDTTYSVFTQVPNGVGLVYGINTTVNSDDTNLLLTGKGWVTRANIEMPIATNAKNDNFNGGQEIASTYIKQLGTSGTGSNTKLVITKGNGSSSTIDIPNTTYSVFTTSADGLAPKASGTGDTAKFLRGDATWQRAIIPTDVYQGATSGAAGVVGLVPAAASGATEKFLRSDGTWAGRFDNDEDGLVPKTGSAASTDILHANGTWSPDILNTTGATQESAAQIASPLYLVGAPSQASEPQTYSNNLVYIQDSKIYQSDGAGTPSAVQVVDVSSTQALTNKTYNGYNLGDACAKTAVSAIGSTTDGFTGDGTETTFDLTYIASAITGVTVNGTSVSNYSLQNNSVVFTTAPANNSAIAVTYDISSTGNLPTDSAVINYMSSALAPVYSQINTKVDVDMVAPEYDDTSTSYAVGDYCIYQTTNGIKLFECNTAIAAPAGDFDDTKWNEIHIVDISGKENYLSGTLTAGSTTLTISDASIVTGSIVQIFTDVYGLMPTNVSVTSGQITMTFAAQGTDIHVKVKVV